MGRGQHRDLRREGLRIQGGNQWGGNGTVGINVSPSLSNSTGSYALQVWGNIRAHAGTFWSWSDERLKENIAPIGSNILDKIVQLEPVSFKWKKDLDGVVDIRNNDGDRGITRIPRQSDDETHVGFIGQQVKEVLPQLTKTDVPAEGTDEKDYINVDYTSLIPYLVQSIKELKNQVDELKAQVDGQHK